MKSLSEVLLVLALSLINVQLFGDIYVTLSYDGRQPIANLCFAQQHHDGSDSGSNSPSLEWDHEGLDRNPRPPENSFLPIQPAVDRPGAEAPDLDYIFQPVAERPGIVKPVAVHPATPPPEQGIYGPRQPDGQPVQQPQAGAFRPVTGESDDFIESIPFDEPKNKPRVPTPDDSDYSEYTISADESESNDSPGSFQRVTKGRYLIAGGIIAATVAAVGIGLLVWLTTRAGKDEEDERRLEETAKLEDQMKQLNEQTSKELRDKIVAMLKKEAAEQTQWISVKTGNLEFD